jgi:hypothetical protein
MIWKASPRFLAKAASDPIASAGAPAVTPPAVAAALNSAPVLPR